MCEELFAFFHTVLDVLKSQMGAESIEATIGINRKLFLKFQRKEQNRNTKFNFTKKILMKI